MLTCLAQRSRVLSPVAGGVQRPHRVPRPVRRAGFTLLEILIVIAIITILFGIGIYGYRSLEESASKKLTRTTLGSAAGLLKEMNSTGSYARVEGPKDQIPPPFYELGFSLTNPGDVTVGKAGRAKIANDDATVNTPSQVRLMKILRSNPKIASMIAGFPSQALLTADPGQPARTVPIISDAWDNPLLLVPSGGLKGVNFENGSNNQTITSSGQTTSPANRAFWASAGPDGDFTKGDDNLYSFQN